MKKTMVLLSIFCTLFLLGKAFLNAQRETLYEYFQKKDQKGSIVDGSIVPFVKFSGNIDFKSKKGASYKLDTELGFVTPISLFNVITFSPGILFGAGENELENTIKLGVFSIFNYSIAKTVDLKPKINLYMKASVFFNKTKLLEDDSEQKGWVYGITPGIGLIFEKLSKNAEFFSELGILHSTKEIYFDKDNPEKNNLVVKFGIKYYLSN